ncbi:MAG: UvrD-helicase domain-containing protein [Spirochaetia bacterium]|jgi:DNA helicase-2/ATP-dependent DNA helicase PcrA
MSADPAYLRALNPEQREAVVHEGAPLLILAGAGSGKTRVITTKIAYLVDQRGVSPRSILAVTFTNKAAQEMKDRVLAIVPHADEVMVRTFHSFGAWFLRRNARLAGLDPHFSIYDEDDSLSLLKGILGKGEDRGSLRRAYDQISRTKDLGIGPDAPKDAIVNAGCDPDVFTSYEKAKRSTGNVDFGDLILMPLELLKRFPEARDRTRQRFRVVLVDEYQDSNVAQFELLRQLWCPGTYLCVVGDDDQSIYKFRGAEVGNILSFPKVFPDTRIVRLERNYRSTQAILDVASAVVSNNTGRLGKTLWTEKPSGEPPLVVCLQDQEEEAELCARIAQDGFSGATAILYRMNAQSLQFEKHFRDHGIRFRLIGAVRFYSREEVKDAIAYLSLLLNRNDEVSFRRIVNKPSRGIGAASVEKLVSEWRARAGEAGAGDLLSVSRRMSKDLPARARSGIARLLACMGELSEKLEETPLAELARDLLSETGLYEMYRTRDRSEDTAKIENLKEMVSDMASYGAGAGALSTFLESIALASPLDGNDSDADSAAVTLITLHNTKGLEFDRVIITGLEEGIFPHESSRADPEDVEEERRLFYVGITRARERLVMTWCLRRRLFGRTTEMSPSRFLDELPESAIQRSGEEPAQALDEEFPAGTGVYHEEYGAGIVERSWYTNENLLVQVRFQSGRVGRFLPKYARLERIDLGE